MILLLFSLSLGLFYSSSLLSETLFISFIFLFVSLCFFTKPKMATSKADGKRSLKEMTEDEEEEEDEDSTGAIGFGDDEKKKGKRGSSAAGGSTLPVCQVENCTADMTDAKRYHRRHKVCEFHAKASMVQVAGLHQRFCQQCSRFHGLSEFDEAKRSCRKRLAGHNERRRKSSSDYHGEGSND